MKRLSQIVKSAQAAMWLPLPLLALGICCPGCRVVADGHNIEGVRMLERGEFHAAVQKFQKAHASSPQNADSYYNMATAYHRMGAAQNDQQMLKQAEALYNQCLDLDENHVDCHRGLAVLLVETGRSDRALKLLKNWAIGSPDVADAHVELARLYQEFGQGDTAKLHLQTALQIDQDNHRAWAALGSLRERDGDYQQALANYRRSYTLNNFQPGVAERIASLGRQYGYFDAPGAGGTRTVDANETGSRY